MLNPLAKAGEGLTEIFGRFSRNPCSSPIQWVRAKNGVMKDPQWRKHLNVESKKTYDEGTVAKLLGVCMLVVGGLPAGVGIYLVGALFQGLARTSTETDEKFNGGMRTMKNAAKHSFLPL